MPCVYRSMLADNGLPKVGRSAKELGVRVPADIQPDPQNQVAPNNGGMSVAPAWRQLPTHRIPQRLRPQAPDATGNNNMHCWKFGVGTFTNGIFAPNLSLNITSSNHGNIEPLAKTDLGAYEAAVAATQNGWQIDET